MKNLFFANFKNYKIKKYFFTFFQFYKKIIFKNKKIENFLITHNKNFFFMTNYFLSLRSLAKKKFYKKKIFSCDENKFALHLWKIFLLRKFFSTVDKNFITRWNRINLADVVTPSRAPMLWRIPLLALGEFPNRKFRSITSMQWGNSHSEVQRVGSDEAHAFAMRR